MTVQAPETENTTVIYVPRSLLGLLVDHKLRMRSNRKNEKRAIRQMRKIGKEGCKSIRAMAAAADPPAGRMARVNYRAGQVSELATTVVAIATAAVTLRDAYHAFRTPPDPAGAPAPAEPQDSASATAPAE